MSLPTVYELKVREGIDFRDGVRALSTTLPRDQQLYMFLPNGTESIKNHPFLFIFMDSYTIFMTGQRYLRKDNI